MKYIDLARTSAELATNNLKHNIFKQNLSISEQTVQIMKAVKEDGIYLIKNFCDEDTCNILKSEMDRIFEAYDSKLWKDEIGAEKRAFGADRVSDPIKNLFYNHPLIVAVREAYYDLEDKHIIGLSMANRIIAKAGNLGSGAGWHRDSVNIRQFKTILYLTDVSEKNGAFQYLRGTQNKQSVIEGILKHNLGHNHNRLTQEDIDNYLATRKYPLQTATGTAGTLLLVDTSGIHRGMPIQQKERYAITNYHWIPKEKGGTGMNDKIRQLMITERP